MVRANSTIPEDKAKGDERVLPQAAWRAETVYASPIRKEEAAEPKKEEASPPPLQEYAKFVLDQEAEYCQE